MKAPISRERRVKTNFVCHSTTADFSTGLYAEFAQFNAVKFNLYIGITLETLDFPDSSDLPESPKSPDSPKSSDAPESSDAP